MLSKETPGCTETLCLHKQGFTHTFTSQKRLEKQAVRLVQEPKAEKQTNTDTLGLRLLWGPWFPSLCAAHPGAAAITAEQPSFHHCSKKRSHYSVDIKFCIRRLLLWSLGVVWLLLQGVVLHFCLSNVTGPHFRSVKIYATAGELFPITYSHKLYQQLLLFFFFLDFILKWRQKFMCNV